MVNEFRESMELANDEVARRASMADKAPIDYKIIVPTEIFNEWLKEPDMVQRYIGKGHGYGIFYGATLLEQSDELNVKDGFKIVDND